MKALEIFNRGDLAGATEAALEQVRSRPADGGARQVLAELFCFAGQFERADKQLETLLVQNPAGALTASLHRQLIRGETARREFWQQGRVPEFLAEPDAEMRARMLALVAVREGDMAEAARQLELAESERVPAAGTCNGKHFDDFRDLDDLCGGILEVLTSTGKFYWISLARVISMEFEPPARPIDLMWRQCQMEVEDGPHGVVYLPVSYAPRAVGETVPAEAAMGRVTEWVGEEEGVIRGVGQRMFAVDDDDLSIMELVSFQADQEQGES